MKKQNLINVLKFFPLTILFSFVAIAWAVAVAQEQPQAEKRWVRIRIIKIERISLADSLFNLLQQGESFRKLAKIYSEDTSAQNFGEIGWAMRDSLNETYQSAIENLSSGQFSQPIQIGDHHFLFKFVHKLNQPAYAQWQQDSARVQSGLQKIKGYFQKREFKSTLALIDTLQGSAVKIDDVSTSLSLQYYLADSYAKLRNLEEALSHYQMLLQSARRYDVVAWKVYALGRIGAVYSALSQYPKTIAYLDSAVAIAHEAGMREEEETWLGNLGNIYFHLGQFSQAVASWDSALVISRIIDDREGEGIWLGNLGNVYTSLGQLQQSFTHYSNALGIAREIGDHDGEGRHLGNLGSVYQQLGQYPKAITYIDSALAISREIDARGLEAMWLSNLGNTYDLSGQHSQSLAYYDSALVIARAIGSRGLEGNFLGNLGITNFSLGRYSQAIAYSDSASVIARETGDRAAEASWLNNLGNTYRSLGQYHKAIAYADSTLLIAKEISYAELIWQSSHTLAFSYSKIPDVQTDKVTELYDNALNALENIIDQLTRDVNKQSYFDVKQELYQDYINYLMTQMENSHRERALEISEASRTRALRDLLQGQRMQTPLAAEKRVAAAKRTKALFEKYAEAQIDQIDISGGFRAGVDDSLETWAAYLSIPPDTLGSTESAPAIKMQQIQEEAKTGTLLEYHVLEDGVAIWVVGQDGEVFSFKQEIAKTELEALVDSVRLVLGVAGAANRNAELANKPVLQTLDSLLIQPIARYLPTDSSRELIILPHDVLFLLPFASLIDNNGKYLVERYTFSTAPSVGLLKFTRERIHKQQQENPRLLLMGNPEMPDAKRWSSLPGAEQEVTRIARYFKDKKGAELQALALTQSQASEATFREIASAQSYLHLATHGYVVSDALRCGLVLAKTGNTMETDGILTTAEIFGLPLAAELVVLSACQTGLGQISSDGVAGLSRAFLYAGTSSLIVSLWKVSDNATAYLMVKFYEELARDGNKARALRVAQLHTMKTFQHPKDWAAFVLVGQPR